MRCRCGQKIKSGNLCSTCKAKRDKEKEIDRRLERQVERQAENDEEKRDNGKVR
jgi:hypothetical protein